MVELFDELGVLFRARLSQSGAQVLLQFGAPLPGYILKKRGEVYYEIHICFVCKNIVTTTWIREKQGS